MRKKSLPKRNITFADLPPSLKKKTSDYITSPSNIKSTTFINEQNNTSYQAPKHARFQLPPTPLTSPNCIENLDSSTSFNKRQIARSVDGNFRVEVGFKSMSY